MRKHTTNHALERLVFFSDAVFAIVITLLILEIKTPALGYGASERQWLAALAELQPHLAAFLLSFLVIGALWMSHHRLFMMVSQYDDKLLWPNLLLLLAVTLLPFTTSLLATGSLASTPFAFYAASLLAAGLLKARLVRKALQPALLDASTTASQVRGEMRGRWIMPIAAATTLALAFVMPAWNNLAMLLLPALKLLRYFRPE